MTVNLNFIKNSISVNFTVLAQFLDSFLALTFWILKTVYWDLPKYRENNKSYQNPDMRCKDGIIVAEVIVISERNNKTHMLKPIHSLLHSESTLPTQR